jgi:hypothetical protein
LDNSYVLDGNFIPWKVNCTETQSMDEGECEIDQEEDSLFEEDDFDQRIISQLLKRMLEHPHRIMEIYQEMQGLWLGCGSDPTFRLTNLLDSLFELFDPSKGNLLEFLKNIALLSQVVERHIDRISEESPTRDIII